MQGIRIGIVGAGIGGLTAALALQRIGLQPMVFEQADVLAEVGAGISITPNAAKGLQSLGLGPGLHAIADRPPEQQTRHYRSGAVLLAFDRRHSTAQYGAEYYQLHRGDLHTLLLNAVLARDPDAVRTAHRLTVVSRDGRAVTAGFAAAPPITLDLLVGADGLRSLVRDQVFGPQPPSFAGLVAWRGLVPATALTHWGLAPGSAVFVGGQRLFVRYPVRQGQWMNYVAFTHTGQAQAESWSATASIDELLPQFEDFAAEVPAIIARTEGHRCGRWGLYARPPLLHWTTDCVALLGDAAHPMLPWFGQGAGAAIEDAVVLARAIAASADVAQGLSRYEKARQPRVNRLYSESQLGGQRLFVDEPTQLTPDTVRNEDSLGIFRYDPSTAEI
jgi:salicylate hydroxylase